MSSAQWIPAVCISDPAGGPSADCKSELAADQAERAAWHAAATRPAAPELGRWGWEGSQPRKRAVGGPCAGPLAIVGDVSCAMDKICDATDEAASDLVALDF